MNDQSIQTYFKLDHHETEVLLALQSIAIDKCIEASQDKSPEMLTAMNEWKEEWHKSVYDSLPLGKKFKKIGVGGKDGNQTLLKRFNDIKCEKKKKIILLEEATFIPFYNLNKRGLKIKLLKDIYLKEKEKIESSSLLDDIPFVSQKTPQALSNIAISCCVYSGIDSKDISKACLCYKDALKLIPNNNSFLRIAIIASAAVALAITGGLAAPAIGSIIGGMMGLSGAAATSAGLAFLGGGAIAAGGFGMAGGAAVIIGGGSILGATIGEAINQSLLENDDFVLSQLAKTEAIVRAFFNSNDDIRVAPLIIEAYRKTLESLKTEVKNLEKVIASIETIPGEHSSKKEIPETKKRIQKMNKSSEYIARAAVRLAELTVSLKD